MNVYRCVCDVECGVVCIGVSITFCLLSLGGLSEFNVLHPSLCEISLPSVRQTLTPAALRATTPGM